VRALTAVNRRAVPPAEPALANALQALRQVGSG
jgi:hypothetical protein